MSVRMRHTRSHTNNRRSHHALVGTKSVVDKESGKRRLPHRLDESTGMYRGKLIAAPKAKKTKEPEKHGPEPKLPKADKHATHDHAEQTSTGIVGKVKEATRHRTRSGTGS
ncbi:MAG: 50S ribosomal protein L32 [Patescibacteria group bacterium]|nr:50S ribosomal protein L32 [Patescibacteria group bacterium]MDE1966151.1 50S ribosomal protein L32 [Patescibacteria group bacterium]